jgi:peptidoglycan glycosyltransferase
MIVSLKRIVAALLVAFLIVAAVAFQWGILESESLAAREDNPRRIEAEAAIRRGVIKDRDDYTLAWSVPDPDGPGMNALKRRYPYPITAPVVGYADLFYGKTGVEAGFDDVLRGEPPSDLWQTFIHAPQTGSDIRLTLDLGVQRALDDALASALDGKPGAGVIVRVSDGAVLAMVSRPGFDPDALDEEIDSLRADPEAPLLNRVVQGQYQPGGILQTVVMSAALRMNRVSLEETSYGGADEPIPVNGLSAVCAKEPPSNTLTLLQAYAYGCPAPFAQIGNVLGAEAMLDMFGDFGFYAPPPIDGLTAAEVFPPTPTRAGYRLSTPTPTPTAPQDLVKMALGQGELTVTPLQMVRVPMAVAGDGNIPAMHIVEAVRAPDSEVWKPYPFPTLSEPVLRADVAWAVRQAMRLSVLEGSAQAAQRERMSIYGHAATAFTGTDEQIAWFIGYALPEGATSDAYAIALVLEGAGSPALAANAGGEALQAAARGGR